MHISAIPPGTIPMAFPGSGLFKIFPMDSASLVITP